MKNITLLLCFFAQFVFSQQLQLDTSFGTASNGFAEFGSQSSTLTAPKFLVLSDNSVLYAVSRINGTNLTENILVKFTSTGVLDTSFATAGIYTFPENDDNGPDIFLTTNNKIMAFCSGATVSNIYRLDSAGTLDTTFGTAGVVSVNEKFGNNAVVYDAGTYYIGCNNYKIIALDSNCLPLTSFGTAGTIFTSERIVDLIKTNDGKFLNSNQSDKLTKYNFDGSIDTTFATSGVYTMTEILTNNMTTVKQLTDGSLLVLKFTPFSLATSVIKLTSGGIPVATFGTSGTLAINGYLLTDAIENNSNLVICGGNVPTSNGYITALNPTTAAANSAFCTAGVYSETANTTNETIMKLYWNGSTIYAGGRYVSGANNTYYLAKYTDVLSANTFALNNLNYINPVQNVFKINNQDIKSIEIYNLQSNIIAANNSNFVDISSVSQGIYLAIVKDNYGNSKTIKIIKK